MSLFSRAARSDFRVGAIAPSSGVLSRVQAEQVPMGAAILEIGAGTGAITQKLLCRRPRALVAVEVREDFANALAETFSPFGVNVIHADVRDLPGVINFVPDVVVSAVPFNVLPPDEAEEILFAVDDMLPPGGLFIHNTYSMRRWERHRKPPNWAWVGYVRVLRNLPPANVVTFQKAGRRLR